MILEYNSDKPHRCPSCHAVMYLPEHTVGSRVLSGAYTRLANVDALWKWGPTRALLRGLRNLAWSWEPRARRILTRAVVTCCKCSAQITRWPTLAPILPRLGVVCTGH